MNAPPPAETSPSSPVQELTAEGTVLVRALRDVLDSLPVGSQGTRELSRSLGIDKSLASRVRQAMRAADPLSALAQLPGPAPLRELLRAAKKRGTSPNIIVRAETALESYSQTLRTRFDDRAGFDAVISDALPEARKRFELTARQAVFRGMAAVKGISTEASSVAFLMHPGQCHQTGRTDGVMVGGYIGLRRVRPSTRMMFTVFPKPIGLPTHHTPSPDDHHTLHGVLLREFCSPPQLDITATEAENSVNYEVRGNEVGTKSSVDLYLAERYPNHFPIAPLTPQQHTRRVGATIEIPTRRVFIDAIIHKSLWPGRPLELRAYDTSFRGIVQPPAPHRDSDLLPLVESIQEMPGGINDLRSSRLPRYVDLLRHVCQRMSWNPAEFRAYRCDMHYPLYGSQIMMLINTP